MEDGRVSLARRIANGIIYAVITTILLIALVFIFSGPTQQERHETNQNVRLLVTESRKNRELVCLAVLGNPSNPARLIPRVRTLCAGVGVGP